MDLDTFQAYATILMTILLVIVLYAYILHLYRSEKKGVADYEKYGKLAVDDEIDSQLIEKNPKLEKEDEGAK